MPGLFGRRSAATERTALASYGRALDDALTRLVYMNATRRQAALTMLADGAWDRYASAWGRSGCVKKADLDSLSLVEQIAPPEARAMRTMFRTAAGVGEIATEVKTLRPEPTVKEVHDAIVSAVDAFTLQWAAEEAVVRAMISEPNAVPTLHGLVLAYVEASRREWRAVDAAVHALARRKPDVFAALGLSRAVTRSFADERFGVTSALDEAGGAWRAFDPALAAGERVPPADLALAMQSRMRGLDPARLGVRRDALAAADRLLDWREQPDLWAALPPESLFDLVLSQLFAFAFTEDDDAPPALIELYEVACMRLGVPARLDLVASLAAAIRSGAREIRPLLAPILANDTNVDVLGEAGRQVALLHPLHEGEPMTGVWRLMNLTHEFRDQMTRAGGILAGAVLLGDRRMSNEIDGWWRALNQEGKRAVTSVQPAELLHGTIDFYLRWLEDPDEMELGLPATILLDMPNISRGDGVVREIEWRLPARHPDRKVPIEDNPHVKVLRAWTLDLYAAVIGPRLRAVWDREGRPWQLAEVMKAWGVQP